MGGLRLCFLLLCLVYHMPMNLTAQKLVAMNSEGQTIPFFTASSKNMAVIKVGDEHGQVFFTEDELEKSPIWIIQHMAFEDYALDVSAMLREENQIILTDRTIDLPTVGVSPLTPETLARFAKSLIGKISEKLNFSKAILSEVSSDQVFQSLGYFFHSGLSDRAKVDSRFQTGNFSFLAAQSRLFQNDSKSLPYKTKIGVAAVFLNDILFAVLDSKTKDWLQAEIICGQFECMTIKDFPILIKFFPDGQLHSLEIPAREFKHLNGKFYTVSGRVEFIQTSDLPFFSKIEFEVNDSSQKTQVYCSVLELPLEVIKPESLQTQKATGTFLSALGSSTSFPDYTVGGKEFEKYFRSQSLSNPQVKAHKLTEESYFYFEKMGEKDPSSVRYMRETSEYIRSIIKTLEAHGLVW